MLKFAVTLGLIALCMTIGQTNGQLYRDTLTCWQCNVIEKTSKAATAACETEGMPVVCDWNDQGCENEMRMDWSGVQITKGCKQKEACVNNQNQNDGSLLSGMYYTPQCSNTLPSVCRCCCFASNCNTEDLLCKKDILVQIEQSALEAQQAEEKAKAEEQAAREAEQAANKELDSLNSEQAANNYLDSMTPDEIYMEALLGNLPDLSPEDLFPQE